MTTNYLDRFWQKYLPDYIDRVYPKGKTKIRGDATVIIILFMISFIKELKRISGGSKQSKPKIDLRPDSQEVLKTFGSLHKPPQELI